VGSGSVTEIVALLVTGEPPAALQAALKLVVICTVKLAAEPGNSQKSMSESDCVVAVRRAHLSPLK